MTSAPKTSASVLELQELAIQITAQDFHPGLINLDVLKMSGVIPSDWELSQNPIQGQNAAQLSFANGLNLVAQPQRLMFLEQMGGGGRLQGPAIAQAYLEKFPHADYQGLAIAPKVLLGFPEHAEAPRQFMTQKLLAPGSWQQMGNDPLRAAVTLHYTLKRCPLSINISEVQLNQPPHGIISALLFTGNFNYMLPSEMSESKAVFLSKRVSLWQTDTTQFREVVYKKFLNSGITPTTNPNGSTPPKTNASIFPDLS